jgi:hypothetical protein
VEPGYPEDRDEERMGKPLLFPRSVDQSDADLVLLMHVIEHVEDDVGLVREYADKVAPGTSFITTVPAFMWLWSGHDVFMEHFRRYTCGEANASFRPEVSQSSSEAISTPPCCLSSLFRAQRNG